MDHPDMDPGVGHHGLIPINNHILLVYLYTYILMYLYTYILIYLYTYLYTYTRTYTRTYILIYLYTYILIHVQKYNLVEPLLELNPCLLIRLHTELGDDLGQGHLHLRHCKALTFAST